MINWAKRLRTNYRVLKEYMVFNSTKENKISDFMKSLKFLLKIIFLNSVRANRKKKERGERVKIQRKG